jgi:hypothetical protein
MEEGIVKLTETHIHDPPRVQQPASPPRAATSSHVTCVLGNPSRYMPKAVTDDLGTKLQYEIAELPC